MGYHHLHDEARRTDGSERKAIAIAGDSKDDNQVVASFVDALGFDPLVIGKLAEGRHLEPGQKSFGAHVSREVLATYIEER